MVFNIYLKNIEPFFIFSRIKFIGLVGSKGGTATILISYDQKSVIETILAEMICFWTGL